MARDFDNYEVDLNDLRAIVSYHEGDVNAAAEALDLDYRQTQLLDLAVTGSGTDVLNMTGGGGLQDHVREYYEELDSATQADIQSIHDLCMDLTDWQIEVMIQAIEDGKAGFSEWLEAWRADGESMLDDLTDSEFWELFREIYE